MVSVNDAVEGCAFENSNDLSFTGMSMPNVASGPPQGYGPGPQQPFYPSHQG